MGDATRNPSSAQYRGDLPEGVIAALAQARIEPTKAWQERAEAAVEAAKAAGSESQLVLSCEDCDKEVVVELALSYGVPMRTVGAKDWPKAVLPVTQLRLPLLTLKRSAKEAFEKNNPAIAKLIHVEDEQPKLIV